MVKACDALDAVLVFPLADPVPRVVAHALVVHEALDHVLEDLVLIPVGHLADVRAGGDPSVTFFHYAFVAASFLGKRKDEAYSICKRKCTNSFTNLIHAFEKVKLVLSYASQLSNL